MEARYQASECPPVVRNASPNCSTRTRADLETGARSYPQAAGRPSQEEIWCRGQVESRFDSFLEKEIARHRDHGPVIRAVFKSWYEQPEIPARSQRFHAPPQLRIRRHPARNRNVVDTGPFQRPEDLLDQNVRHRGLKTCAEIVHPALAVARPAVIAKPVPHRGLNTAETEIEALVPEQRAGKFHEIGIPRLRQPVEHGSARKAEAKHFRNLVVGLARSIVERFPQEFMFENVSHQHKLCVSPGNRQTEKGEIGLRLIDEI